MTTILLTSVEFGSHTHYAQQSQWGGLILTPIDVNGKTPIDFSRSKTGTNSFRHYCILSREKDWHLRIPMCSRGFLKVPQDLEVRQTSGNLCHVYPMGAIVHSCCYATIRCSVDASFINGKGFSIDEGNPPPWAGVTSSTEEFFRWPSCVYTRH